MPALPAWASTIRPPQQVAAEQVVRRFQAGTKVVFLEAPTGSGKTLVGELARRALDTSALYLCVDRGLQDQVLRDFSYAQVIKGRRNYPTQLRPFPEVTCDDCTAQGKASCSWCPRRSECAYLVAKRNALGAELACANAAYFLSEANGPGGFSCQFPLIIADEADRLESLVMSAVSVTVAARNLQEWDITPCDVDADPAEGHEWLVHLVLPAIASELRVLGYQPDPEDVPRYRRFKTLVRLEDRLETIAEALQDDEGPRWVITHEKSMRSGVLLTSVVFKPVQVHQHAPELLWAHGTRWLLMSATILNPAGLARDLGLAPSEWAVVRMPSTFAPERRPVYLLDAARVTAKTLEDAVPKLIAATEGLLLKHATDRVLVHMVSFKLMEWFQRAFQDNPRACWYRGADERAVVLDEYLRTEGSVLFAPALERGLDLPDDACRVVIIAKLPYPDLGDKQIAARLTTPGGQDWYRDQMLRSLIQMSGRGMRHAEDHCVTYILDSMASEMVARHSGVIPRWWMEAVL